MSAIASALVCAVKFVNSFARRQYPFDIAAAPVDVDSNFLSYPASLSLHTKCNYFICIVIVIMLCKFHRNPFSVLAKGKTKEIPTARDRHGDNGTDKAKT